MLEPVRDSAELFRVLALPRRRLRLDDGARLAVQLSELLRQDNGTRQLRPYQAICLSEFHDNGGLFAALPVGEGKTDIAFNLPYVAGARRPLLLIPANLREKTYKEFGMLANQWISPRPPMQIESYSMLAAPSGFDLLYRMQPDLLVLDEGDKARNTDTETAERIDEYLEDFPETKVAVLTGTILRKSLRDFAHLLRWALRHRAPIPTRWIDLEQWANAIDLSVNVERRQTVGALCKLIMDPAECDRHFKRWGVWPEVSIEDVREGFRLRLEESPGVVISDSSECQQDLVIRLLPSPSDPALDEAFHRFRTLWETPDGWPLSDPLSVHRHANEMSCGFYYAWDPRPPAEWLEARTAWTEFVREKTGLQIRSEKLGLSSTFKTHVVLRTEAQVAKAFPNAPELLEWKRVSTGPDAFVPNSVARWFTTSAIDYVREWIKYGPGIIWVNHITVGETIAKLTGLTFYSRKGQDADGNSIEHARKDQSVILSIQSNMRGRNLQHYNRNLIYAPPPAANWVEQIFGRTHRAGQDETVYVDWIVGCTENLDAFYAAEREAGFVKATQGHTQKILNAIVDDSLLDKINNAEPRFW